MATLLSFIRPGPRDWSNDEKAQFARIQKLLADAGVFVDIEHGRTDEGDPWCVLCSGASGEVIIHVARIDGQYLFDSAALPRTIEGRSLDDCAQRFIDDAALLARRPRQESKILLHPSSLLVGVMLTIYLYLETTGESVARGKALPDPAAGLLGALEGADIIDVAKTGDAPARAGTADAKDDEASPLLALKQLLQQIAEASQKPETDRTGGPGAGPVQNWVSVLLPTVVATIAYTQDSFADLMTGDAPPPLPAGPDAATDTRSVLVDSAPEDQLDPGTMENAETTVIEADRGDPSTPDARVAEAMLDSFLMITAPAVRVENADAFVEPAAPVEAAVAEIDPSGTAFVFAADASAAEGGAPPPARAEEQVALMPGPSDISTVSRLMQFISGGSIDIRDETVALSDFIEALDSGKPVIGPGNAADPARASDIPVPLDRADTLIFLPFEPAPRIVSSQEVANQIAAFVKVTGQLRYDTSDRSHLTIYDRSLMGREDSAGVEARSFAFHDESTVTFVGLAQELDMVFA